uniref:Uncharacterized protein n=1 Tax=Knipowitschia caucasica TaxID=637954 RepID=A0AAV2L4Y2_KNICA
MDPHLAFILIRSYEKMMAPRSPKASTPKTTTATGDFPSSIGIVESDRDDLSVAGVQPFIELTGEWTHQVILQPKAKCPLETVQQKIETVSELMRTQVQRGQETTSVP